MLFFYSNLQYDHPFKNYIILLLFLLRSYKIFIKIYANGKNNLLYLGDGVVPGQEATQTLTALLPDRF